MLGLDAQTLAQYQMHPNFMQDHQFNQTSNPVQTNAANKHLLMHQNYSFDDHQYYDGGLNNQRMNLLQQAQSHSFNMDMLSGGIGNHSNQPSIDLMQQQQFYNQNGNAMFQRNNPKRNTLRRTQRVIDNSNEDLTAFNPAELAGLTPQQQQQILMMRSQQYSNNSSGQESGIGTASNFTSATNSAHGTNDLLNTSQHQRHKTPQTESKAETNTPHPHQEMGNDFLKVPPPLPRRKSLPSIVKSKSFKEDETAHSSSELNNKNQETYIIENGIRKRVTEKTNSAINQKQMGDDPKSIKDGDENLDAFDKRRNRLEYDSEQTPQLPRKIVIESISSLNTPELNTANSKRVSMPSIPAYLSTKFANKGTYLNKTKILPILS